MALANYSDLQTAIANFINRDDLGTYIPDFIALAESRIATDLETNELHTTTTLAISSGSEALPANFKGLVRIKLNGTFPTLDYITPDSFHSRYASNFAGRPVSYTIEANTVYFAPTPDSSYTATYTYIAKPDLATDLTNRLMTINPNVYLFACLMEAADFIGDDDAYFKYEGKYGSAINSLNSQDQVKGALSIQLSDVP